MHSKFVRTLFSTALAALSALVSHAVPEKSDTARVATTLTPTGGRITVEAEGTPPPAPLFFTASANETLWIAPADITGEIKLSLRVLQGRPEVLSLGLAGEGDIVGVSGAGLRDWSVRQGVGPEAARRFLDLRPVLPEKSDGPRALELTVQTRLHEPAVPGKVALLLVGPGDAVGFDLHARVFPDAALDLRLMRAAGVLSLREIRSASDPLEFVAPGDSSVELNLTRRGAALAEAELAGAQLTGHVDETAHAIEFRLHGTARVERVGARLRVLAGGAALNDRTTGDGWHVELRASPEVADYEIVFDRKGVVPVDLGFSAALREEGDWRRVNFQMPAGTVVPVVVTGLADGTEFDPAASVVLATTASGWQGFLPADGGVSLAWKRVREKSGGTLFFTSTEESDVRVGAGVLRESSAIAIRILQGKLDRVRLKLDGPGEIVGVEGRDTSVLAWNVATSGDARVLDVRLSRPIEGQGTIVVNSQSALGGFPVRAEALRLTPEGGVRHAGYVRIANRGAVRLEIAEVEGLVQLAPAQFPNPAIEDDARQVFVYRFPAAERRFQILASQILPEVGVSEIATYELGEAARVLEADVELDIREAPLRDWALNVPADYAVVAVQGTDVADYAVESAAQNDARTVKIIFSQLIDGRHLLHLRLEKNQAAAAGEWQLPPLAFPGAKTVRGHLGVIAAPGFRLVPGKTDQLAEVPLGFFPKQVAGLQQAFRLREANWSATLAVEALGQSVQADVFHLYSLKEGAVYASVLVNYFVVGAPASEWRLEVPATAGNIDVIGQGVRRDWRREGNQIVVALHQPVLGPATLLVTFEEPMSARGGTIMPGEVRPLGVQSERGYLQVVSPLQVKNQVKRAEGGLLRLEPLELPAEFRVFTTSPSLAVYQYTARPFALELGVDWYQPGETVDQVIDFAKLTSQVSRDGQVVTDARFFVKTRGRKALRLELGEGVKLWEARVDNELVNARADGGATLVPMPARLNPNEPVEVALRLGQAAGSSAAVVRLVAPKTSAPVVIGEWTLHSDPGRLLVPRGGNATPTRANLKERGFEWISSHARYETGIVLGLIALAALVARFTSGRWLLLGILASAAGVFGAGLLARHALEFPGVNSAELGYAATVVPADTRVFIEVANVAPWRAMISWPGVAALGAGLAGAAFLALRRRAGRAEMPALAILSLLLAAAGLLAQRTGEIGFFAALGAGVLWRQLLPLLRRAWEIVGGIRPAGESVATTLMFALVLGGALAGGVKARADLRTFLAPPGTPVPASAAQSMIQRWDIRNNRLHAELTVTIRGVPGESFLLLHAPAVITEFTADGLRVAKSGTDDHAAYFVTPEREGVLTAQVKFELPVPDLSKGLPLLTGPSAMQRVTIVLDQPGWEFSSPMAVQVESAANPGEGHSGATLVLGLRGAPEIQLAPRRRDPATEATQFFAEAANLYLPGAGVVNGVTGITIRPVQGRVSAVDLDLPAEFTVGDVTGGPIGAWRFDPEKRRLHVAIEPAQTGTFRFVVDTQRGAPALPFDLALQPLRIVGAAGEVGLLALAFGGDAQPENVQASGMTAVSVDDFDRALVPVGADQAPLATLQSAYRYTGREGAATLRVAAVAPEVRVTSRNVISLGDDRLVLASDLGVAITRVGLFKLSFPLPAGLELESASGAALSHWSESVENGQRVVTLHLNGRTLGEQNFSLTLVGPVPGAQAAWAVPRIAVREATRQTGELQLVPERGIRLRALDRTNVSELDARALGGAKPGTLAFRLLQENWALAVGIETLEPWVTVQSLEELTVREGQTQTRLSVRFRVENAAVKQLRVRLPGLTAEQIRTVRATGAAVGDLVPAPGEAGRWEIHFRRGVIGETAVQLEFQGPADAEAARATVTPPVFEGARQVAQFVAVRAGGRLELEAGALPRGWQKVDWSAVPAALQDRADRSQPALAFRVAEAEEPLAVTLHRHEVADALKLRVTGGVLTTALSADGPAVTAVDLDVEVAEKSSLRARLPDGARLFNVLVNGGNVSVVREGEAYFFHVAPNSAAERTAKVRLVYAVMRPQGRDLALLAPGLNVPLENVSWHVVLPPGYRLADYHGALRLRDEHAAGTFDLGDYQSLAGSKRAAEAKKANDFLRDAGNLVQQGRQELAGEVLSRVFNGNSLDEATNEDARVQLRALKTQQTILGLNTRRQRLYLDNNGDAPRNEQLEQAAKLNPFMKGKLDFDPHEIDQLLQGNTVEENAALQGIAGRMVDQQLATEPAPAAIDVTLPERGQVLTFMRSLQVDGGQPLELDLTLEPARGFALPYSLGLLAALGLIGGIAAWRPRATANAA